MLLHIPAILDAAQLADIAARLDGAAWGDGRQTAGPQSARVKNNLQLDEDSAEARALGQIVTGVLERHPIFLSAALPRFIYPPLFNRYEPGMGFGTHIDNAVRRIPGTPHRIRTDLSATLFLSDPASYDGGELVVEDSYGEHSVKLAQGDMVLYPASSLHHVKTVLRGARIAAFFWVQSMVRGDADRELLFQLDTAIRLLGRDTPDSPSLLNLTGCYHNLIRRWADL